MGGSDIYGYKHEFKNKKESKTHTSDPKSVSVKYSLKEGIPYCFKAHGWYHNDWHSFLYQSLTHNEYTIDMTSNWYMQIVFDGQNDIQ